MRAGSLAAMVLAAAACSSPEPSDPYCTSEPLSGDARAALRVDGTQAVHFLVFDPAGKPVDNKLLGETVALAPGKYQVRVNNTVRPVTVAAGKLTRCATGTLTVESGGTAQYHVTDKAGTSLEYGMPGKSLSFFPGEYTVTLGDAHRPATIEAGQHTSVRF